MKILFVSAVLPYPLHSGGQIRIYNLLKRLSKNREIHLASFIRSEEEKKEVAHLSFCQRVTTVVRGRVWQPKYIFGALTSTYPLLWSSYHNSDMLAFLSSEISTGAYDLIHIEPGYVWPSLPETKTPVVVCEHNIEHTVYEAYAQQFSIGFLRPFLLNDVKKMKSWQQHVWKQATHIVTVSESDRLAIGQPNVSVVPNGVDVQAFAFHPKKTMPEKFTVVYVGNFRWMENRDAAEHLIQDYWPAISKAYPRAQLRIVGKNAPKGPYYIGGVDRIQDEFDRADMMVAPIRIGGGTKYKILEAMAAGLPVITSSLGIEGMHGDAKKQYLIAENITDVLEGISFLQNDAKRLSLVKSARALIETEYSWDLIAKKLDRLWTSL